MAIQVDNALIFYILLILLTLQVLVLFTGFFNNQTLKKNIKSFIESSVQTKFIEAKAETKDLIELAIEIWRLEQRVRPLLNKLDENDKQRIESSLNKFKKFLNNHDISVNDFNNIKYNEGISGIEILSVEKDPNICGEQIKEIIEPAVFIRGKIIKNAKAVIASGGN